MCLFNCVFVLWQNTEELKARLAHFQASENQQDSNDKVHRANETLPPDTEAENETQTTENNSSQIQNGKSSQDSAESLQEDPPNTEDQTQTESEIVKSEELSNSVDRVDNSCTAAAAASDSEPDPEDHSTDRTGTMSPKSFATFKGFLVHPPQMNLPWESMRSVRQCTCGIAFSYSVRKVTAYQKCMLTIEL